MTERLRNMDDTDLALRFAEELEQEELKLLGRAHDVDFAREIGAVRADLCTQHGFESHELQLCETFMRSSCPPEVQEPLVPMDYCLAFARDEHVSFHAESSAAHAGAPGAAAGPAPGPSPALFGGKFLRELPEQGLEGEAVKHEDQMTMGDDWMQEHGKWSGSRSFQAICADHPGNEWCRLHGLGPRTPAPMPLERVAPIRDMVGQEGDSEKSSSWSSWWPWPARAKNDDDNPLGSANPAEWPQTKQAEDDTPADNKFPVDPPDPKPAWKAAEESGLPQFEPKEPKTQNRFPDPKSSAERRRLSSLLIAVAALRLAPAL